MQSRPNATQGGVTSQPTAEWGAPGELQGSATPRPEPCRRIVHQHRPPQNTGDPGNEWLGQGWLLNPGGGRRAPPARAPRHPPTATWAPGPLQAVCTVASSLSQCGAGGTADAYALSATSQADQRENRTETSVTTHSEEHGFAEVAGQSLYENRRL